MANRSLYIENALSLVALRSMLRYDPETGFLWWRHPAPKRDISKPAGFGNGNGYLSLRIGSNRYLAHRVAWFYVYGEWPQEIDHINRNRCDNRLCNLRSSSRTENMINSNGWSTSTLGVKNISQCRSGFRVQ